MNDVTKQNGNAGVASTDEVLNGERQEGAGATEPRTQALVPPVDIVEQDDCVRIIADLPGVTAENVTIELENGKLRIEADRGLEQRKGIALLIHRPLDAVHQDGIDLGEFLDTPLQPLVFGTTHGLVMLIPTHQLAPCRPIATPVKVWLRCMALYCSP